MKALFLIAMLAISLGTFGFVRMTHQGPFAVQQTGMQGSRKESPFACDTLALTTEIRKRHFDVLGPKLISLRTAVRELPNGYEFEFPNNQETYQVLSEWAFQESQCCPFFDLNIRLEREHGALVMSATGREGTKAFIQADAGRWIQPVK